MAKLPVGAAASLAVLLLWITGCHDPDRFVLTSDTSPPTSRLFTLAAVGDTILPADGVSAVGLVATVRDVSEGAPLVLFTTTAGALRVGAAGQLDSATVQPSPTGEATVELVSASAAAVAQVRARVLGVTPALEQDLRVHFTTVAPEEMLAFVAPPDSAFAHGLSLVPVTVRIAARLEGDAREVRFETTQGTFPMGTDTTAQVQTVRAGNDGLATAFLRSSDQPGTALVRAEVAGFRQETIVRFVRAPADSILQFAEAPPTAPADGHTLSRFVVQVSPRLLTDADRTVRFTTTAGSFGLTGSEVATTSVQADAAGTATAYLRSPAKLDEAIVQATAKGFVQQRVVPFEWAGPDSIVVTTEWDEPGLAADGQMDIKAELLRLDGRGRVTRELVVSFAAADSAGAALPGVRFVAVTRADSLGRASAIMLGGDTTYRGRALITVRPARIQSSVFGQAPVLIVDP